MTASGGAPTQSFFSAQCSPVVSLLGEKDLLKKKNCSFELLQCFLRAFELLQWFLQGLNFYSGFCAHLSFCSGLNFYSGFCAHSNFYSGFCKAWTFTVVFARIWVFVQAWTFTVVFAHIRTFTVVFVRLELLQCFERSFCWVRKVSSTFPNIKRIQLQKLPETKRYPDI